MFIHSKQFLGKFIPCFVVIFAMVALSVSPLYYSKAAPNLAVTTLPDVSIKLTADDGTELDGFGSAMAIDSNTLVIGVKDDDDNGDTSGSAYVFARDNNEDWTQQAKLLASDGAMFDTFGISVAVSGNTIVVGAPQHDDAEATDSGAAYVFVRDNEGNWTEQAKLIVPIPARGTFFGQSVAISGNTVLIGAIGDRNNGLPTGSAYVFVRDNNGDWTQQTKLTDIDGTFINQFGWSVALDSNTAIVGDRSDDGATVGTNSGSVYVFVRDNADNWTRQAKLTANDAAQGDEFGYVVALDSNTAVVGARYDDDIEAGTTDSGSAYVFVRDNEDSWTQQAKLTANDGATFDEFGFAVAIDGDTVVIGAPGYSEAGVGLHIGAAYVFARTDNTWMQEAKWTVDDAAPSDNFGWSVAINGDTVAVGAIGDDELANGSGAVYVYDLSADSTPPEPPIITGFSVDSGLNTTDNLTNDTELEVTGTAEPNSTVTLTSDVDNEVGSTSADNTGDWTITTSTLTEGVQTLTATATDSAGNTSNPSEPLVVTIDITNPIALCRNAIVRLNLNNERVILSPDVIDNGSSDDTAIAFRSAAPSIFTTNELGTTVTVTLRVADTSGNQTTCTSDVFVTSVLDVNADGIVSPSDATYVINRIDADVVTNAEADINADGMIDETDVNLVISALGTVYTAD